MIRVKVPSGMRLMPHSHQENLVYTVMSTQVTAIGPISLEYVNPQGDPRNK